MPRKAAIWRGITVVLLSLLVVMPLHAADVSRFHALYGELLERYWRPPVTIHDIETTVFDYAAMQREATPLFADISAVLARLDLADIDNQDQAKAFWINVYNFAAMRMVVKAYPVDSITSFKISLIKHPWSKDAINVAGRDYSLSEIEKDILLPRFKDPRIIFAVSCAAVSCPDRIAEPFTGGRLDAQLDTMIREFLRNPGKGFKLDREANTVTLAWILKKDSHLFEGHPGGVLGFIQPYLDADRRAWLEARHPAIDYFDHDWTLNDLAQADSRGIK